MEQILHLGGLGEWSATAASAVALAAVVLFGLLGYVILFKVLLRFAARPDTALHQALVRRWRHPAKLLLPLLAILLTLPTLQFSDGLASLLQHLCSLALILAIAWLLAATILGLQEIVLLRYDVTASDNLKAREVSTQVNILVKIVMVLILIIAGAAMLMTFDRVRQVGMSLLASAGIAGVIIGFAAQRSLATFIAGIQIAITQPIRLDDVVIVEGEWGHIEEITLTYVVVCIWDLRRLVLPITYFLEKPFQNWTRVSADLLDTVTLHCDYRVPVAVVRSELESILAGTDLWDGKASGLVVLDATDRTVVLRALVSAKNSGEAWDLRCHVREKLVEFLQREYPDCLPRVRAEVEGLPNGVPRTPERSLLDGCSHSE
ncbi:mechanosensitive ion channel family protein [Geobacter sp. AOG2]|uniref:mechanosensitive ion channel family protein n=1 Tax=Geobacter sp. AOG2 TaxID=1566347 RepID=UPI001CC4F6A8|nr:mechanosensitive ion channel family protein [Geobacter sp. AOG2]GFE60638.1 mechanosensitive ion channel protein MscS [Geobacter sp. AOG2]